MSYIDQFIETLVENSVANDYEEAIKEWTYQGDNKKLPNYCICGHPILINCVVCNSLNRNELIIGNCCIRKFGVEREHWNKSRKNYLEYALSKATTSGEEDFINRIGSIHFQLIIAVPTINKYLQIVF